MRRIPAAREPVRTRDRSLEHGESQRASGRESSRFSALPYYARATAQQSTCSRESENRLQFEDTPPAEIYALDLRQNGAWSGDEAYVEAIDPTMGRSLAARIRPFALGAALLLLAGFVFERVENWRDRRDFPQIGRSVNIGGRSLNLYCSGMGSPTSRILDSGGNQPGHIVGFLSSPKSQPHEPVGMIARCAMAGAIPRQAREPARISPKICTSLRPLALRRHTSSPGIPSAASTSVFSPTGTATKLRHGPRDSADELENPDRASRATPEPCAIIFAESASVKMAARASTQHVGAVTTPRRWTGPVRQALTARNAAILHALQFQAKTFDATTQEAPLIELSIGSVQACAVCAVSEIFRWFGSDWRRQHSAARRWQRTGQRHGCAHAAPHSWNAGAPGDTLHSRASDYSAGRPRYSD